MSELIEVILGSVLISSIISCLLTYILTLKHLRKEVYFRKRFEHFEKVAEDLTEEIKDYFILAREIINKNKNLDKIKEFEEKLIFYERKFRLNNLYLFESKKTKSIQEEYFKLISKLTPIIKEIKEKKIPKQVLNEKIKELMLKQHLLLESMKEELKP